MLLPKQARKLKECVHDSTTNARADELFRERNHDLRRHTSRLFAGLLITQ
jgi:hypothetical protein